MSLATKPRPKLHIPGSTNPTIKAAGHNRYEVLVGDEHRHVRIGFLVNVPGGWKIEKHLAHGPFMSLQAAAVFLRDLKLHDVPESDETKKEPEPAPKESTEGPKIKPAASSPRPSRPRRPSRKGTGAPSVFIPEADRIDKYETAKILHTTVANVRNKGWVGHIKRMDVSAPDSGKASFVYSRSDVLRYAKTYEKVRVSTPIEVTVTEVETGKPEAPAPKLVAVRDL